MNQAPLQTTASSAIPIFPKKPVEDAAPTPIAAGVVLVDPDGMILFLLRSANEKNYAGHWCLPGGGIDPGETPEAAARREVEEETGRSINDAPLREIKQARTGTGGLFVTYVAPTDRFIPKLVDGEHAAYAWAPADSPPEPIHPGVRDMLVETKSSVPEFKVRADPATRDLGFSMAMDAESVREITRTGQMKVARSNIARACVSPYKGHEIPNWMNLGLEPNKIYMMLRDPDELAKAVPTFNGLQILREHKPVSAADAQLWDTCGATGTDAEFDGEVMTNSLHFWTREAIDGIESETKRELSPAYHYRADMTPGEFAGKRYDGVMRDIVGNHVALVRNGRQGPDIVVMDSGEEIKMSAIKAVARRTVTFTALHRFLKPQLAMDSAIELAPAFKGVKNFKDAKPAIAEYVAAAVKGKLKKPDMAFDEGGLKKLLDALEDGEVSEKEVDEVENAEAESAAKEAPFEEAKAEKAEGEEGEDPASPVVEDEEAALRDFLGSKGMAADDINTACSFLPKKPAADMDPDAKADPVISKDADLPADPGNLPDPAIGAKDNDMKDMVTKPAMDAAIKLATESVRKTERAISSALRDVRPYVGDLDGMAFDSADEVYRHALTIKGVDGADKLEGHALKVVLGYQPKLGALPVQRGGRAAVDEMAMDSAAVSSFDEMFPGAARIGQV